MAPAVFLERDASATLATDCHSSVTLAAPSQRGSTYPTGPAATHTLSAVVFARTCTASPAPGSRTNTRLSPGCTGTRAAEPSDNDIVNEPSLLAR